MGRCQGVLQIGRSLQAGPSPGPSVTTDTLLLGSFLRVGPGTLVVDLGCGTGGAIEAAIKGNPECRWLGMDFRFESLSHMLDPEGALAGKGSLWAVCCRVQEVPSVIPAGVAGAVMMNPPYVTSGCGRASPSPSRAASRSAPSTTLYSFLRAASHLLAPGGELVAVLRPSMLPSIILGCLTWDLGVARLQPVGPSGKPAVHVLARCVRGSRPELVISSQRTPEELTT